MTTASKYNSNRLMSHERNLDYLVKRRIIYRRTPIDDQPTESFDWGDYYENGTYECYELFRSRAKITTYKSLKWHMYVLWYLNPQLDQDQFHELSKYICNKRTGFVTFSVSESLLNTMVYDVSMMDLEEPPRNKLRKIIFKEFCKLTVEEKLKIAGDMATSRVDEEAIYQCMLDINDMNQKITIKKILGILHEQYIET